MQAPAASEGTEDAALVADQESHALLCRGSWTVGRLTALERSLERFTWPDEQALWFDAAAIQAMDTAGAWLLHRLVEDLRERGRQVEVGGLSAQRQALLKLVAATGVSRTGVSPPAADILFRIGCTAWDVTRRGLDFLAFVGEAASILGRSLVHPARIRSRAVLHNLQVTGFNALPITGLLAFLMGVVIAYQGAEQLRRYGANIFIADLVGLAMLRELAPLLTAIIIAGRSGSAFTAQIGTMKVTEEIDALRTIGVVPIELLVLPKLLALLIALPLLTVYADMLGVFGGMVMARTQLGVNFTDFLDRFAYAITLPSYFIGVGKAPVFAAIIAAVGCYQGFQVTGSADSVGRQTTVSVVEAIFLVILADAAFSVVFSWLGI